jgi:threonine dehydratase
MRCVRAPASLSRLGSPDPEALESVRHLGRCFPRARVREVPLLRAAELDARADPTGETRVWLALEALQVTGSVHVRGALVALAALARNRAHHVVVPTLGNFGVAVAYAARMLDMSATVVVPRTTPRIKREKIERYGATLVVAASERYADADALAREIAVREEVTFLARDDHPGVALGDGGSLGFEIVRGLGGIPERVLAPLATGALTTGLAWALAREAQGILESSPPSGRPTSQSWAVDGDELPRHTQGSRSPRSPRSDPERTVWGVQSESAAAPTSLAEELHTSLTSDAADRARASVAGSVVVDESHIGAAMAHAYQDMGLVLEGSAALALAPILFGLPEPLRGGDLVVVLTGRNVDPERLEALASVAPPFARDDRASK